MMQVIAPLSRRFWFTHHGRTLSKEGVEAHIEIALALSRGDAKAARLAAAVDRRFLALRG